jgi:hypothetical protein
MPGSGRGAPGGGRGAGRGAGRGGGKGMMGGNRPGSGPGGNCLCPACQLSVPHARGVPCYEMKCPRCGGNMVKS